MQKDGEKYTLPKSPAPGKAMIYVVRPYSGGGGYIFNVFVDDKEPASEMGYTRGGQYICFNLEPGKHLILSSAGNWAEMEVNAKTGEIIYVRQRPRTGYLPELYWNELSLVSECEGKYLVRRLEPGVLKHADKPETK
ncbi:hypothetical protein EPN96_00990 [bacterium]|nr:MAG: hypothetical protein EPN96_00990 [bacterium]